MGCGAEMVVAGWAGRCCWCSVDGPAWAGRLIPWLGIAKELGDEGGEWLGAGHRMVIFWV